VDPTKDLELTRLFRARYAALYACWTDPRLLVKWFAPPPVITREAVVEARPGGAFRTVMRFPDGTEIDEGEGCVLVADAGRRFTFTDAMSRDFRPHPRPALGFTAEMTFAPEAGGTRYSVVVRHATPEARKAHEDMGFHEGWGIASSQLGALAETL
jgi:uncharacterized protein YndB with AHSA1/START domain